MDRNLPGFQRSATNEARRIVSEFARDFLYEYARAKKPWPLAVMLMNMNHFLDVAKQSEVEIELKLSNGATREEVKQNIDLANVARIRAQECAKDAAPYMHAKLAQIEVSGETETKVMHLHAHAVLEKIQDRSDQDLAKFYQSVVAGKDISELIDAAADANGRWVADEVQGAAPQAAPETPVDARKAPRVVNYRPEPSASVEPAPAAQNPLPAAKLKHVTLPRGK